MTKHIKRDISAGEVFKHEGSSVIIEGNIGKGAKIFIEDGGLQVKGTIADDVEIELRECNDSGNFGVLCDGFSTAVFSGGMIIINGVVVSKEVVGKERGLMVEGAIGDNVSLKSRDTIELRATAGNTLKADAENNFKAKEIGEKAKITAGNSIEVVSLGMYSEVISGNSIKVESVADFCIINADNSVKAEAVGKGAQIKAGNSIKVGKAYRSAGFRAGNKTSVASYIDDNYLDFSKNGRGGFKP